MASINLRRNKPAPGIDYSELNIPDDQNLGTGTCLTVLKPNALAGPNPISSIFLKPSVFQISVNLNPATKEIPILLGKADNSPPTSEAIFSLPENIKLSSAYTFDVSFTNWKIEELKMDGIKLHRKIKPGTVSFWFEPKNNPKAFSSGVNVHWGVFPVNDGECTIDSEEKILCAILNRGTARELTIFSRELNIDPKSRHMVAVTWSENELNLYLDGELLETIDARFYD